MNKTLLQSSSENLNIHNLNPCLFLAKINSNVLHFKSSTTLKVSISELCQVLVNKTISDIAYL